MKDKEYPNCYRIRKVYRETFQKDNPKNLFFEMTSGCGGTGGVRRSILGDLECSAKKDTLDFKINTSENLVGTEIQTQKQSMFEIIYSEDPVYEYTEIGWEGTADELALFILIGGC